MVSEVDEACERLIVEGIRGARPDDGILSEEGASADGTSGVRWVIDPIDGTTNYLYGHPGYAISIAVELDGRDRRGRRPRPDPRRPLHGGAGRRATRNGIPIEVSGETELGSALVATGFAYTPPERVAQAEQLARLIGSIRDIRRMGAAAVDLCSVACGRVDAFYERGLNRWDLAAGELIAETAGARHGRARGRDLVVASAAIFEPLRDAAQDAIG